jgi:hypothetical protein
MRFGQKLGKRLFVYDMSAGEIIRFQLWRLAGFVLGVVLIPFALMLLPLLLWAAICIVAGEPGKIGEIGEFYSKVGGGG